MKHRLMILSAAVVALGLAGCNSSEGGNALPGDSSGAPTSEAPTSASSPSSSSSAGTDSGSVAIDPCSLVSSSDLAPVGDFAGATPKPGKLVGLRYCDWQILDVSLRIGVRDKQGVDDAKDAGGGIQHDEADGRKVARIPIPSGGACIVAVEITDSSRADIQGLKKGGTEGADASCELAVKVAQIVEPKLPKG